MTSDPARAVDLATLVAALDGALVRGTLERKIAGLAHDSRSVKRGDAFVALRGERSDGHAFLEGAIAAGASALFVESARFESLALPAGVAVVGVPDTRRALSRLASAFYGNPSQALAVAGITGTNGKTTTSQLVAAILEAGGIPCGRIGTLGAHFGGAMWPLENTTPLALELQATLAAMRDRGARAVAMEVSSHALALERVADVAFEVAALTNVTRDHLDFHGTLEAYAAAKRTLFDASRYSVFNADDSYGARWTAEVAAQGRPVMTYGLRGGAGFVPRELRLDAHGSSFELHAQRFTLRLPGRFNVMNALAAIAIASELGMDIATCARGLASVEQVAGRMEHFGGAGIDVVVDYAHTPDALHNVLEAVRETAAGRVVVVFGCGGDRDRGKRSEMGRIASDLADAAVVTSDNPRTEDPQKIADDIVRGFPAGRPATVELDRGAAIRAAIVCAQAGDVVVVAGKGHETYQIVGTNTLHFDDRDAVRAALAARAALSGGRRVST
ncbi:MAG: UDP-N-acetylmuramoyl-L-alanyl-D-glutamate--2,6-diaminopimelate ligase [Candidatus Eremiobacteraeota bacterium]|nr:UDP-N-acetylmuramoyl-L-alanyl-D-glutamate--2,6-diaminopimelate ligase [Candidatus Eremiobacteraeota bacterium]